MVSARAAVHSPNETVEALWGRHSQNVQGWPPLKVIGELILACSLSRTAAAELLISPHDLWRDDHIHQKTCLKHSPRDLKAPLRSNLAAGTNDAAFLLSPLQRSQILGCCGAVCWFLHFPLAGTAAVPAAATTLLRWVILAIGAGSAIFVSPRRRTRGTSHPPSPLSSLGSPTLPRGCQEVVAARGSLQQ